MALNMYACIDLGSNSFHLLIGIWVDGRIEIIERCSEKVQLGENVAATGEISADAFQRGLECLQHFKLLMDQYPIEQYWALGTNTFRVANNARKFIKEARKLGIEISAISGVQEAVLVYAGVISALPPSEKNRLIIDIGGGSTEVIIGKQSQRVLTSSLAIGSVAWRDRFFSDQFTDDILTLDVQMDKGLKAAKKVFNEMAPAVFRAGWLDVYASSGTSKMLMLICQEHGFGSGTIKLKGLLKLREAILTSIVEHSELPGIKEARRDLLLAGWCVMVGLMMTYEIRTIQFSATALREGMLDFLAKNKKTMKTLKHSDLPAVSQATD